MNHMQGPPLLRVENLSKSFHRPWMRRSGPDAFYALKNVTVSVPEGSVLGLIGKSGCGKSTLARCILRLIPSSGGSVFFRETEITRLSEKQLRPLRRHMQIVFQDSVNTFPPRLIIWKMLEEIAMIYPDNPMNTPDRITTVVQRVGLPESIVGFYPHQLSGGQRQRLGLARALMTAPSLLIADEPVYALDPSVQAQILNLMKDLREKEHLTMIFISHELPVIRFMSDIVAVMFNGYLVERAPAAEWFNHAQHPYSLKWLELERSFQSHPQHLAGIAALTETGIPHIGCVYFNYCPIRKPICGERMPDETMIAPRHFIRCHAIG